MTMNHVDHGILDTPRKNRCWQVILRCVALCHIVFIMSCNDTLHNVV